MEKVVENKMGTQPINKLMLSMGIPMILSMMLQALYNVVDSYFVSNMPDIDGLAHTGEYAVNALTLAFPVQMLMVAIGVGTGVGINAVLSRSLGQGDRVKASKIAGNAIFIGICMTILFMIFAVFGVGVYLSSQTSDPIVFEMGKEYLFICTICSVGIVMFTIYEKLLQATGRTFISTIAQVVGAITNIIFDPIFIFGYLGFQPMGIKGAAYATVMGQIVSLVFSAAFHYLFNKDVDNKLSYLIPSKKIIKEVFTVGVPAIIMQALMSFMTYGVNIIFGQISDGVVTAYGVYYKIQQFIFFAAFGLNNAIIPIISFNFGMQNKKRITEGIKYGLMYTLIIMAIGLIGLQVFANQLAGVFSLSDSTMALCVKAIKIVSLGYLFAGANIAFQGIFQALNCGIKSLIVSLLRLIVVPLPLAFCMLNLDNAADVVWWVFVAGEGVALVVSLVFMISVNKNRIKIA